MFNNSFWFIDNKLSFVGALVRSRALDNYGISRGLSIAVGVHNVHCWLPRLILMKEISIERKLHHRGIHYWKMAFQETISKQRVSMTIFNLLLVYKKTDDCINKLYLSDNNQCDWMCRLFNLYQQWEHYNKISHL